MDTSQFLKLRDEADEVRSQTVVGYERKPSPSVVLGGKTIP